MNPMARRMFELVEPIGVIPYSAEEPTEAMFALEGARCVPLGVRTPVFEIVRGAESQRIDIVALSFSPVVNPMPRSNG